MRLSPLRFGFAAGATLGLGIFGITLIAIVQGQSDLFFELLRIYPGYELTLSGAALGFLWAFIDGFFGGYLLAWLYNGFGKSGCRTSCCLADRCRDCHACSDCGDMACGMCDAGNVKTKKTTKKKTTTKAASASKPKKKTTRKKTAKKD